MQRTKCRVIIIAIFAIMTATLILASSAAASSYKIIHAFRWSKGPTGNLARDAAGNLYGTASFGGGSGRFCRTGCGSVWKLKPNANGTWTVSILHYFKGPPDGAWPSGVIFDPAGNLYGTTGGGGSGCGGPGCGTVFKLAPNPDGTWAETVLYSFTGGADGGSPDGGLIFDTAGNLYGTTAGGGIVTGLCSSGCGTVFKLAPNSDGTWTESVLYAFSGYLDGGGPTAGLIFDAASNLYGTTEGGGSSGWGTVFMLAPNPDGTWTESVLYSFTGGVGGSGGAPSSGVVFDAAGNLYGTTSQSGAYRCGVVFKLAPNSDGTWTESVLHSFTCGADGDSPEAGLIFDAVGNLYGTTLRGGSSTECFSVGCGVVFKLIPDPDGTWKECVVHSFLGYGRGPRAPLLLDPAGHLYGTSWGQQPPYGLVFEITP